jgi:PPOX class probable F420-dependent enzyme
MPTEALLTETELAFLSGARRAVLATLDDGGLPRLVPICFVVSERPGPIVYSPLDEKPKRIADPRELRRVRDIAARPEVALLVDRWSEDWNQLGWLRATGRAELVEPGPAADQAAVVAALRAKYPQYASQALESRPLIRITVTGVRSWGRLKP